MSAGLEAVKRKLRTHAQAAIEAGRQASHKQGEIIAGLARSFVPEEDGELRRSIRVEAANTVTVMVKSKKKVTTDFIGVIVVAGDETTIVTDDKGNRYQNAKLQEYGARKRKHANPYFNPARRMRERAARAAIGYAIRKAWKGQG